MYRRNATAVPEYSPHSPNMGSLRSGAGEAIAETLLSILIFSMGALMLAGALMVSMKTTSQAGEQTFQSGTGHYHNTVTVSVSAQQEDGSFESAGSCEVNILEIPTGTEGDMLYSYLRAPEEIQVSAMETTETDGEPAEADETGDESPEADETGEPHEETDETAETDEPQA